MLQIKNLHASAGDSPILKGVNLVCKSRQIHAIMGPNGSGKSTLAYTLAGHPDYRVKKGSITFNQSNMLTLGPDKRARAGIFLAFQNPVIIEGVSVQNMLKVAFESTTKKPVKSVLAFRKELQKTAQIVGIKPDFLSRPVNDGFSGGEKKRLEIIQMLTLKPKVAILDEVDSGLDIDSIKLAAIGIKYAVDNFGTTTIIITHYRRILDHIKPDHVHVMIDGRIVKSDGPKLINQIEESGYKNLKS